MTWKEVNDKLTLKPGLQCLVLKTGNSMKRIFFASKCCVPFFHLWSYHGQNSIPNEYFVNPKEAGELGSTRLAWEKNEPSNLHSPLPYILNWQLSHKVYFNYAKCPLVRCRWHNCACVLASSRNTYLKVQSHKSRLALKKMYACASAEQIK